MWRAVGSLCAVGWLPGDRRPPLWRWPEFRLGHPAAEIGDWRAGGRTRQTGRRQAEGGGGLQWETRRCAGVDLGAGAGLGAAPNAPPSASKELVLGQSASRLSLWVSKQVQ